MVDKKSAIRALWKGMAADDTVETLLKSRNGQTTNIGFVNQFKKHASIPNKWFDWENRVNSSIMIIGQDWGPYSALYPYIERYEKSKNSLEFDYDRYLFATFSSRTEKFIIKAIESTFLKRFNKSIDLKTWNDFIFTVAVMFTRQGTHFRGNEFYDESFGIKSSYKYLRKQIEIVNPKVIIPLGGTAWKMVRQMFKLEKYPESISDIISFLAYKPIIAENSTSIIPIFHPASHTDPKLQLKLWKTIWLDELKYKGSD